MSVTPMLFHTKDYRGATIEDLNIPHAISINPSSLIRDAIGIGFENEFTYLPVIHEVNKRLLGIINLEQFKDNYPDDKLKPQVFHYMLWFNPKTKMKYENEIMKEKKSVDNTPPMTKILKPKGKRYSVLTPFSPLEDLASFFNRGNYFAIVTNDSGNVVYGVVTPQDLMKYEQSRPKL